MHLPSYCVHISVRFTTLGWSIPSLATYCAGALHYGRLIGEETLPHEVCGTCCLSERDNLTLGVHVQRRALLNTAKSSTRGALILKVNLSSESY